MHQLITNAKTNTKLVYNENNNPIGVTLTVNDKFQHHFDHKSRITKFANQFGADETNNRFNNGHFFFVNDKLTDYRESDYQGFIHNENNINQLMDVIGYNVVTSQNRRNYRTNTPVSNILLYNQFNTKQIQIIPGDGGLFDSHIGYMWSPFHPYVKSVFELVRLICTNGMVATNEIVSAKVPLVNQWVDNLNVATKQIELRVHSKINQSMINMSKNMANISIIDLLHKHATNRLNNNTNMSDTQLNMLHNIANITSIDSDFKNNNLGKFIASNVTQYDAFNIATEIASHTPECDGSSTRALQIIANNLVFNENKYTTPIQSKKISPFSDTNQAFFGLIN